MLTEHYSEAAAMYQQAISLGKTPDMLKVKLGRAQLWSGQVEMGKVTLESLLSDKKDAAVLNGAAYELSDANLDLPAAETAAHDAVAMASDRSAAASLETATDSDLQQMPLLAESWDTLGWSMFKQHRLSEAENYVRCAWLLGNHDEVGLHLGQIYEAEGKKSEAIATYRMAAGLISSAHPWPYYAHMREMLLAKAGGLEVGKVSTPVEADSSAAVELRTYTIPSPVHGVPATAEFLLHMTDGRVDGVRFLRGDASLKAAEGALEATKYNAAVPVISRANPPASYFELHARCFGMHPKAEGNFQRTYGRVAESSQGDQGRTSHLSDSYSGVKCLLFLLVSHDQKATAETARPGL